jgi:hypothetical protein
MEQKTNKMRSLVIHAPEGKSAADLLKNTAINGWKWSDTGFPPGSHQHCLRKGDEFVALRFESEKSDRANSSNVMPYDNNNDPEGANKLIKELSSALTNADINNSVIASVNDLNN